MARFLRTPPLQTLVGKPEIVERYHQTTKDDAEVALVGQSRKSRQSRTAPHFAPPVSNRQSPEMVFSQKNAISEFLLSPAAGQAYNKPFQTDCHPTK